MGFYGVINTTKLELMGAFASWMFAAGGLAFGITWIVRGSDLGLAAAVVMLTVAAVVQVTLGLVFFFKIIRQGE